MHVLSSFFSLITIILGYVKWCEGNGWPETQPVKRGHSLCLAWLFSDQLIWISFSNCPRRCCFSLTHAAQASMARFYFHDISFLCRKAQRTNYQASPFQAQAHAQASQRPRERKHVCNGKTPWSNTPARHTAVSPTSENARLTVATVWMTQSAHIWFASLVFFPGVLSVSAQASLFFSTGGSCAAKYCDALQKGKEHLLQPVKP